MAVEEEDPKDRETWCAAAKSWYCKAANRMPNVGRLYHHLAILARPHALQQVYLYSRALFSVQAFPSARESIQTVFVPLMAMPSTPTHIPEVDAAFIKTVACIFKRKFGALERHKIQFHTLLYDHISRTGAKWREYGVYVAGTCIGALMDFGNKSSMLAIFEYGALEPGKSTKDNMAQGTSAFVADRESEDTYSHAADLFFDTLSGVLRRHADDRNAYPYLHVVFIFILALGRIHGRAATSAEIQGYITRFTHCVPWQEISRFLTALARAEKVSGHCRFESDSFVRTEEGECGRLPEDYLLRGTVFTPEYFPSGFFADAELDEDRLVEAASTSNKRVERLLWIGYSLAQVSFDCSNRSSARKHADDSTNQMGCFSYDASAQSWTPDFTSPLVKRQNHTTLYAMSPLVQPQAEQSHEGHSLTYALPSQPMEGVEVSTIITKAATASPSLPIPVLSSVLDDGVELSDKIGLWTSIVVDQQSMMSNGEVFRRLVNSKWTLVVPNIGEFCLCRRHTIHLTIAQSCRASNGSQSKMSIPTARRPQLLSTWCERQWQTRRTSGWLRERLTT
jgi:hypothetical protein